MKEININIEGYNVNGICVGCLNYKRKMFYHEDIHECYKKVADIDIPDGLEIQLCWECLAAVRKVKEFQRKVLKSYEFLINYSIHSPFLNSPEDFTKHASSALSVSDIIADPYEVQNAIKTEEDVEIKDDIKEEPVIDYDLVPVKEETELSQDSQFSDEVFQDAAATSDEDIQLSELKMKKEKKEKKTKKRGRRKAKETDETIQPDPPRDKVSRKLKNLPSHLVELYTMGEEEMWQIRHQDANNKEFTKLRYRCDDCVIVFNTSKLRDEHMNGKHRDKGDGSQCDVCKAYFLVKENISAHRALHAAAYRCKECGMRTTLKRIMVRHGCIPQHHDKEYSCVICNKKFSNRSKLAYHRIVCDQDRPQCDCCGKVFANKMTLKYHLKVLPQNKDEKAKEKMSIPCKGCGKIFNSKKSYRAHVVIHDGLTYPCQVCGKLFQWKRNLARHMRNHREKDAGATHECRECGKKFSSRDCYNNHMKLSKRHATEQTYAHECNFCGKKFPTKWCMVDHVDWDHLKRIKYRCSVCFKAFKTSKIMVAHVNNLHKDKEKKKEVEGKHLCEICGKSYKTVKRLKSHMWSMHTNRAARKNAYTCKICPATFTWQTSIYKHMKMMHDTKRNKTSRPSTVFKPQETYNPVDYFQANITQNINLL